MPFYKGMLAKFEPFLDSHPVRLTVIRHHPGPCRFDAIFDDGMYANQVPSLIYVGPTGNRIRPVTPDPPDPPSNPPPKPPDNDPPAQPSKLSFNFRHVLCYKVFKFMCHVEHGVTRSKQRCQQDTSYFHQIFLNLRNQFYARALARILPIQPADIHCAYTSTRGDETQYSKNDVTFQTDSISIGVDTHCSATMSPCPEHFHDLQLTNSLGRCTGINGTLSVGGIGTFYFKLMDDEGVVHDIVIPNSLYIPDLPQSLISPFHWAQQAEDHAPIAEGTGCKTNSHSLVLFWNQKKFKRTIPLASTTNTPTFHTSDGNTKYNLFQKLCAHVCLLTSKQRVLQEPDTLLKKRLREADADYIADENVLLGKPEDWSMLNGELQWDGDVIVPRFPTPAIPEVALLAKPLDPCPFHTQVGPLFPLQRGHTWGECSHYARFQRARRDALTFDAVPDPDTEANVEGQEFDQHWVAENPQAELLRWHFRLGHLPFDDLSKLAENGEIPRRLANSKVRPPKCSACYYATKHRTPWTSKSTPNTPIKVCTRPGECVSVYQLQPRELGFVAQMKGILTRKRYTASTVFVDHFSRLYYVHHQETMSSAETVDAKIAFEKYAARFDVRVEQYHADNGRFADNAFIKHCEDHNQHISYCGVNAHHQNGIAESAIKNIQNNARKSLLYAQEKWPAAIHTSLWPYAIRYAVYVHNTVPTNDGGESILDTFAGTRVGYKLTDYHTFGCPVFALHNALAAGHTIPKWNSRARLGVNLGPSPSHARNVYLVLNLTTGCVSPQFHVSFDDFFETVGTGHNTIDSNWQQLSGITQEPGRRIRSHIDEADVAAGGHRWSHQQANPFLRTTDDENLFGDVTDNADPPDLPDLTPRAYDPDDDYQMGDADDMSVEYNPPTPIQRNATTPTPTTYAPVLRHEFGVSSRGRQRQMSRRMQESVTAGYQRNFAQAFSALIADESDDCGFIGNDYDRRHDAELAMQERMRNPIAFHAEMMGDTMYFHQALKQPDSSEFVKAVAKEINGHVDNDHWRLVRREDVPEDTDVVPSVWAMRRKRNLTTNSITKYKARLNLHGGKQTYAINYWETYAPVVTWFAIRLVIILALNFGYALKQIDFVMAYTQAPIEMDMYMELPAGVQADTAGNNKGCVLQLLANLYGQKQAGLVWNEYGF